MKIYTLVFNEDLPHSEDHYGLEETRVYTVFMTNDLSLIEPRALLKQIIKLSCKFRNSDFGFETQQAIIDKCRYGDETVAVTDVLRVIDLQYFYSKNQFKNDSAYWGVYDNEFILSFTDISDPYNKSETILVTHSIVKLFTHMYKDLVIENYRECSDKSFNFWKGTKIWPTRPSKNILAYEDDFKYFDSIMNEIYDLSSDED